MRINVIVETLDHASTPKAPAPTTVFLIIEDCH
jgi:hypothetical protein